MKLPTLYKKTSTGAMQSWTIEVTRFADPASGNVIGRIETVHGQVGGKLQTAIDYVKEGKNIGKKNATDAVQQAEAEAQAKWEKQVKKGYVREIEQAEAGAVDTEVITGGISPMLAHKFSEQGHKIVFPAYVQPKLDGHRCIAIIDDGVATLWTRTRKPITGVPHINRALEALFPTGLVQLDGELYNHSLKQDFEKITSFVRQEVAQPGHEIVQYHVYDIPSNPGGPWSKAGFQDRFRSERVKTIQLAGRGGPVLWVKTQLVEDEDDLMESFKDFLKEGYEGAMIRNAHGLYVNKRSYDLQKVKTFLDDEFEIVDVEAGRGKMADKAIFVCKTPDGTVFRAKMKGNMEKLAWYLTNKEKVIGKLLTVKYQGLTGASKVPRFPVAERIRED